MYCILWWYVLIYLQIKMPLPKALASLPKLPCVVELNAYLDNSKFEGLIIIAPKGGGDAVSAGLMPVTRAQEIINKIVKKTVLSGNQRLPSSSELGLSFPEITYDLKHLFFGEEIKAGKCKTKKRGFESELLLTARDIKKLFVRTLKSDFPMWSNYRVDPAKLPPSAKVTFCVIHFCMQ